MFKVVNSTVTVQFCTSINLYRFSTKFPHVKYDKAKFSGARMRIFSPKCTLLIFSNGKVNVLGCKSLSDTERALSYFSDILSSMLRKSVSYVNFNRSNIVMSATLPYCVDLIKFKKITSHSTSYEPELFTGLHYSDPLLTPMKMTLFTSGKFFLTGLVSEDDGIINFALNIEPLLFQCAK